MLAGLPQPGLHGARDLAGSCRGAARLGRAASYDTWWLEFHVQSQAPPAGSIRAEKFRWSGSARCAPTGLLIGVVAGKKIVRNE